METIQLECPINLKVVRFELDFTPPKNEPVQPKKAKRTVRLLQTPPMRKVLKKPIVPPPPLLNVAESRDVKELIEDLLNELYADGEWASVDQADSKRSSAASWCSSTVSCSREKSDAIERHYLEGKDKSELRDICNEYEMSLQKEGARLARHVQIRDRLRRQQSRLTALLSVLLRHTSGDNNARFSVRPGASEGGYGQWLHAMRLVARLPTGIPHHFRKKLWLTLSEKYLDERNVDWVLAERSCFWGTAHPEDSELGAQIVKDLHRTGCSLFCGTEGRENQAMLRRVLLAYARWNKEVGYCQGFNMLAAIILEVMEKSESDSLKVMIYLVEAVLPEGYFADDLRGLSADMGAFRDLLRLRIPKLAQHMDKLQKASDGGGVEPPLPDVFTMQWFLTLYATWLPREALLRVWDLIMLDGNELLLLTALAIWEHLQDRILLTRSADEFYSCMGNGAGYIWESGDVIVTKLIALGGAPELPRLRNIHRYQVSPPIPPAAPVTLTTPPTVQSVTRKGLKLFYSEDEGDSSDADEGNKMALATVNPSIRRDSAGDKLSLDIGALKRQYARLRERQRQAHIILAAACARHATIGVPTTPTSLTVNNLLLGKSAIVSSRGRIGPPPGAIPPSRIQKTTGPRTVLTDSKTINWNDEKRRKSLVRRDSIKWKDIRKLTEVENETRKSSLDSDEAGDGVIVSETEAKEMMSSMRTRSISESSSYSSRSDSSSDTSLCDDNLSDNDSDPSAPTNPQKDCTNIITPVNSVLEPLNPSKLGFNREENLGAECNKYDQSSIELKFDKMQTPEKAMLQSNTHLNSSNVLKTSTDEFGSSLTKTELYMNSELSMSVTNPEFRNPSTLNLEKIGSVFEPLQSALMTNHDRSYEKTESSLDPIKQPSKVIISPTSEIVKDKKLDIEILRETSSSTLTKTSQSYKEYLEEFEKCSVSNPTTIRTTPRISPLVTPELFTRYAWEYTAKKYDDYSICNDFRNDSNDFINNVQDLNPVKLSPIDQKIKIWEDQFNFDKDVENIDFTYSIKRPDIIDSLVTSPNFIPDIELSDKKVFEVEKSCQSPGNESICISEDEPIIPLKIDKYFEHSPEFFGARKCDPNDADIPNRRAPKRYVRYPKKPDSLNLQSNYNQKYFEEKVEIERAASFPQGRFQNTRLKECWDHSFKLDPDNQKMGLIENHLQNDISIGSKKDEIETTTTFELSETFSRRNSERALQIIQENSKILSRILTKQIVKDESKILSPCPEKRSSFDLKTPEYDLSSSHTNKRDSLTTKELKTTHLKSTDNIGRQINSSILTYDSDPNILKTSATITNRKNEVETYGWENKVFIMKENSSNNITQLEGKTRPKSFHGDNSFDIDTSEDFHRSNIIKSPSSYQWKSIENRERSLLSTVSLINKKGSILISSSKKEERDDKHLTLDFATEKRCDIDYRISDSSSKNTSQRVSETALKDSQSTDFAKIVTSSVSFSYDPSCEENSPKGVKSDSSDTLCQIASLDQISTPISPKCLLNTSTPSCLEGLAEKCDKYLSETDDTCSPITSLLDTETFSSLSCPKSPSSSSYHPFPTRPIRTSRDLGIRLGLYSKDSLNSPSK